LLPPSTRRKLHLGLLVWRPLRLPGNWIHFRLVLFELRVFPSDDSCYQVSLNNVTDFLVDFTSRYSYFGTKLFKRAAAECLRVLPDFNNRIRISIFTQTDKLKEFGWFFHYRTSASWTKGSIYRPFRLEILENGYLLNIHCQNFMNWNFQRFHQVIANRCNWSSNFTTLCLIMFILRQCLQPFRWSLPEETSSLPLWQRRISIC